MSEGASPQSRSRPHPLALLLILIMHLLYPARLAVREAALALEAASALGTRIRRGPL